MQWLNNGGNMADQTLPEIREVQEKNKAKARENQNKMRDDMMFFILNCNSYNLMKMYETFKTLKRDRT